jgi:hypothetical protein
MNIKGMKTIYSTLIVALMLQAPISLLSVERVAAKQALSEWNDRPIRKKGVGPVKMTVRNWGGVYTDVSGYSNNEVLIQNTTRFNFKVPGWSKKPSITFSCKANLGTKTEICFNFLKGRIESKKSGVDCNIKGKLNIGKIPGLKAKLCTQLDIQGKPGAKPNGSVSMKLKLNPGGVNKTLMNTKF